MRPLGGRFLLIYQSNDTTQAGEVLTMFDDAVQGLESPLYLTTVEAEIAVALGRAEAAIDALEAIEVEDLSPGMRRLVRWANVDHLLGQTGLLRRACGAVRLPRRCRGIHLRPPDVSETIGETLINAAGLGSSEAGWRR